ncbi:MAG: hypothetical protein R2838_15905 [Caldilineaceae bacterium]
MPTTAAALLQHAAHRGDLAQHSLPLATEPLPALLAAPDRGGHGRRRDRRGRAPRDRAAGRPPSPAARPFALDVFARGVAAAPTHRAAIPNWSSGATPFHPRLRYGPRPHRDRGLPNARHYRKKAGFWQSYDPRFGPADGGLTTQGTDLTVRLDDSTSAALIRRRDHRGLAAHPGAGAGRRRRPVQVLASLGHLTVKRRLRAPRWLPTRQAAYRALERRHAGRAL